jgi:hypothetical protein
LNQVPRADAKTLAAAAAAALPSITESGMSLGPVKAPHAKIPGWEVATGVQQLVSTKW